MHPLLRPIGNNEFGFTQGTAGDTGETYFTVGIRRGQTVEVIKSPQGEFIVFKDKNIAQKIQADYIKLQQEEPNFFTDTREKAEILVVQVRTGKNGKVIIPSAGEISLLGR